MGGESIRQRLINLMYLVFIAMLALNVSREVLFGFGQVNNKMESSNENLLLSNADYYERINLTASEQQGRWLQVQESSVKSRQFSDEFYQQLEDLKLKITERRRKQDPELNDFSQMESSEELDNLFFSLKGVSSEGQEFLDLIINYRESMKTIFEPPNEAFNQTLEDRFGTGDAKNEIVNRDGQKQGWLEYHFEGFPLISSVSKLSMLQNDVRQTEYDALRILMGDEYKVRLDVTQDNYITLLNTEKPVFYQGDTFEGDILLGRRGGTQNPNEVEIYLDDAPLDKNDYTLIPGGIKLNIPAGRSGEHKLTGNLVFFNEGQRSVIPVNQSFTVISKPNSAVVSADKMNVVYRGVVNPLTISIPGVPDNNVSASAQGLSALGGSKYQIRPGVGREANINVTGVLADGQRITTTSQFRIKEIPKPVGYFRGRSGSFTLPRSSFEKGTIEARLEDFDFDLTLRTKSFRFRVPNQASIVIQGNRLDSRALNLLRSTRNSQVVVISDIDVEITSNTTYQLRQTTPISITIN